MTTEERFERLEKQNRQLRMGLGVLVLILPTGFMVSQAGGVPEVVTAKAFGVVNYKGMPVVILGTGTDGEGLLRTFNGKEQELVGLRTTPDGEGMLGILKRQGRSTRHTVDDKWQRHRCRH